MIVQHHLVFGRKYGGVMTIPYISTNRVRFYISTRVGSVMLEHLDGTTSSLNPQKNIDLTLMSGVETFTNTYASNYTTNFKIKTLNGNADVYSFGLGNCDNANDNHFNIEDISLFFEQFPNLYSIFYRTYAYGDVNRQPTLKGNLIKFGNSVRRCRIEVLDILNRVSNTYVNLNEINSNSQLEWFYHNINYAVNYIGDLARLPPNIYYFVAGASSSSSLTYTAGKTWASSFDTLNLGNAKLSLTDTDNLLIDMNNSITTAIGSKVINLANCSRSSNSDTAVSGLTAKGFTVTCTSIGAKHTITFDLGQNVTINGTVTRAEGHDGRLNAIQFGSGNLVSADPLPASQIWSIAFWVNYKNTNTATGIFNINDSTNTKLLYIGAHVRATNRLTVGSTNAADSQYNEKNILLPNGNTWYHVVVVFDRTISGHENEIKFYLNKVLTASIASTGSTDQIGSFVSGKATIGSNTVGITTSPIKIFNYPLTQSEIDNLYNE